MITAKNVDIPKTSVPGDDLPWFKTSDGKIYTIGLTGDWIEMPELNASEIDSLIRDNVERNRRREWVKRMIGDQPPYTRQELMRGPAVTRNSYMLRHLPFRQASAKSTP